MIVSFCNIQFGVCLKLSNDYEQCNFWIQVMERAHKEFLNFGDSGHSVMGKNDSVWFLVAMIMINSM